MSLEEEVDLIRRIPIFAKSEPAMQKLLCFTSERLSYRAGQVMFREGDAADAAYVVVEGEAEVTVETANGPLVVNNLGRNDIIGEIAIFSDVPRTATVTAKTDLVTLKISKDLFTNLMRESPDAALELIRVLADKLVKATEQLSRSGG